MALTRHTKNTKPHRPLAAPIRQFSPDAHIPHVKLAEHGLGEQTSYELLTNELLLDGQARLNLATFVTTWMPSLAALAEWVERYDSGEWDDPPGKLALLYDLERIAALLREGAEPFYPERDRAEFTLYLRAIGCIEPPTPEPAVGSHAGRPTPPTEV